MQTIAKSPLERLERRIDSETLYHGSIVQKITKLTPSKEGTFGVGLYLTNSRAMAERVVYLDQLKRGTTDPGVVYECTVKRANIIEWGFRGVAELIADAKRRVSEVAFRRSEDDAEHVVDARRIIHNFDSSVLFARHGKSSFATSLEFLGYDGVRMGHMTVIFDPDKKVDIVKEHRIKPIKITPV